LATVARTSTLRRVRNTTSKSNDSPQARSTPLTTCDQSLICKHWMRGLCKKGETCEFLHEYNLRKMPECNRQPTCPAGDECPYQHTDPAFKRPSCPHYERGFCPLGPICANRHILKTKICPFYLCGFCPNGKECQEGAHPRFPDDLKPPEVIRPKTQEELDREREEADRLAMEQAERDREMEERGGERSDRGRGRGRGWGSNRRRGRRGKRDQF
jgi:cleavage and polyadenylation specificity factor subunit 4